MDEATSIVCEKQFTIDLHLLNIDHVIIRMHSSYLRYDEIIMQKQTTQRRPPPTTKHHTDDHRTPSSTS